MTKVTSEASLAPVAAFVIISAAVCWWVMQAEQQEPVAEECKPAILHQQAETQYGWAAYHGRCLD